MPDTDILVSELNSASQINTTDLLLMTQPDGDAQTGYSSRKGTILQVANKLLKDTEYTTDLPNFDNKSVFGALNEIHNGTYLYKENETPYQHRQTPITANRTLEKLIGVSCAFNQLVTSSTGPTITQAYYGMLPIESINIVSGHKYLLRFTQPLCKVYVQSRTYLKIVANVYYQIPTTPTLRELMLYGDSTGSESVSNIVAKSETTADGFALTDCQLIDLTACFGSEVADYFYNLEQNTAGSGIALFRQLLPEDYYAYQTAHLESSKPTSKVIYDSDNNVIATYPLGGDELRGLLKVENGQLVAYGDIKDSSGNIDVIFGHLIFDGDSDENWQLQSGVTRQILFIPPKAEWNMKTSGFDENLLVAGFITTTTATTQPNTAYLDSGYLNLVFPPNTFSDLSHARTWLSNNNVEFIYTLATPTTASGTPFTNPMLCGSTEEFTDTRSLKMFCGHDSLYYTSNFKYW